MCRGGARELRLRPPPLPEGKGGCGQRQTSQTRRLPRRGRLARDPATPGAPNGHAANAVTCVGHSSSAGLPRAPLSPFINSPPAPRPLGAGASQERRAIARPPAAGPGAEAASSHLRMQPTATMATAAATTATVALTSWDNATGHPTAEPDPILDNYVLLVVVMSLFVGGTLVVLSGVLLLCKRCWEVHQRFNRAVEEAEKTTTTYLDNGTHPAQDPDFRGEDPEGLDTETERFLSASATGRRVSFNEAALFEQSRKTQDKGRRLSPSMSVTRVRPARLPPPTQLTPTRPALPSSSSALPGDPYNSAAGTTDFAEISPSASSDSGEGTSLDATTRSTKAGGPGAASGSREVSPGSGAGTVLQFFTRLRRHASLDGASPYFKVKRWKLEPSQRAASLDTRGSPKRHHFQRQRAASESMEQEGDTPHTDFIQYIARASDTAAFPPPRPFLASPTSPPPSLGRLKSAEAAGGVSPESSPERSGGVGPQQQQPQQGQQEPDTERDAGPDQAQTSYRDLWSLRASLELHAAASDHSSSGNDRDSVRSGDSSGSGGAPPAFPPPSPPAQRPKDGEARRLLQMDSGYASIEGRGAGDDAEPLAMPVRPRSPRAWPRRPRRDYSIDEKTDALFHEFLRHDPHFDDAPLAAARHRARAHPHARKQWQRGRQHSDPGARAAMAPAAAPGVARLARAPLRRGDSVDGPPDGRVLAGDDSAISVIEEEPGGGGCSGSGLCVEPSGALLDKLAAGLEERLFPLRLAEPVAAAAALVAAAPTSPDHSPV
ncbi:voltage-dependent calcium channel beta subunit-associated regulatory protein isoform X2 [Nycticebus coucang]|uniref:voltage-dependent calcium channel beta subunit-associated regulatory protein isoform X2 n=1 Tax=Nycticebus coucang TaxID=9470 RepID=UPI00234D562B|nr:voltage-dependent calcium channel beta subunit-associated regulatory protein isoform X2 [Nycticebus coucang]